MRLHITGRHVEITDALRRYVEERVKRLARYSTKLGDVQVVLGVEKHRHTAEMMFAFNGAVIQSKIATNEMYSSIDQLVDKISRQVRKRKEKLVDHKRGKAAASIPHQRREKEENIKIVRVPLQTLTRKQALEYLGRDSSLELLVFLDATTDRLQVMRRLENGTVELVDPQPS